MNALDSQECKHGVRTGRCTICNAPPRSGRDFRGQDPRTGRSKQRRTPENTETYYGHPWPEWLQMEEIGRQYIVEKARRRQTTKYGEMWAAIESAMGQDIGQFRLQMPNLLRRLAETSLDEFGLVVTALVVYDQLPEYPGEGLFQLAVREGLLPEREA